MTNDLDYFTSLTLGVAYLTLKYEVTHSLNIISLRAMLTMNWS